MHEQSEPPVGAEAHDAHAPHAPHAPHIHHDGSVHTVHAHLSFSEADSAEAPAETADSGQPQLARVFFDSYVRGVGYIAGVFIGERIIGPDTLLPLLLFLPLLLYALSVVNGWLAVKGALAPFTERARLAPFVLVWRDFFALTWGTVTWLHLSTLKFMLASVWARHSHDGIEIIKIPLIVLMLVALRSRAARARIGQELVDEYVYGIGYVVGTTLGATAVPYGSTSAPTLLVAFGLLYGLSKNAETRLGDALRTAQPPYAEWLGAAHDFVGAVTGTLMWLLLTTVGSVLGDKRIEPLIKDNDVVRFMLVIFTIAALTQSRIDPMRPNSFVSSFFGGFGFVLGSIISLAGDDPKTLPQTLLFSTLLLVLSVRFFAALRGALRRLLHGERERSIAIGLLALVEVAQATVLWYHLVTVQMALDRSWLRRVETLSEAVRVPLVVIAILALASRTSDVANDVSA